MSDRPSCSSGTPSPNKHRSFKTQPGTPSPKKCRTDSMSLFKTQAGTPSPKKSRTDSTPLKSQPGTPSPRKAKFRPKKYYSPKKASPRKSSQRSTGESSLDQGLVDTVGTTGEVYYTANFKDVLNKCLLASNPERHVISKQEATLVEDFMHLESTQQQLYVRLFLRKHHWIRVSKISYGDIGSDLSPIFKSLCQKKFLSNESDLKDPSVVLGLLQVGELKALCKQFHLPASVVSGSKAKMISSLFKQDREHQPLFGKSQFMVAVVKTGKASLGGCVRLAEKPVEVFSKLMLLFSITNAWLNRDEDNDFSQIIYRMLQVSIGKLVYPDYNIITTQPLFKDMESFEKYYEAVKEEQCFQQSLEESDYNVADIILKKAGEGFKDEVASQGSSSSALAYFLPFTCGHVLSRLISHGVEYREKLGKHREATELLELLLSQSVYGCHRRGKWWDRLALNWDYHLKDKFKCLDVIKRALVDPSSSPAIRLSLVHRARRTLQSKATKKRKLSFPDSTSAATEGTDGVCYTLKDFPEEDIIDAEEISIDGKQLCGDSSKPFFLTNASRRDGDPGTSTQSRSLLGVEAYAIGHYVTVKGWPCAIHAENSTFSILFALLTWDVLFSPVPDVFRAPFQNAPLDLFSGCFYANRREKIENKVHWIRTASEEEVSSAVENSWEAHFGQVCVGVDWNLFPEAGKDAKNIAMSLGNEALANICELFSRSYRGCCSGLPDLTLWNPKKKTIMFVEVKGPGDKLSCKQIVWLSRLAKWNCSVEVCRVRSKS